jgi:hypothetical protein
MNAPIKVPSNRNIAGRRAPFAVNRATMAAVITDQDGGCNYRPKWLGKVQPQSNQK